MERVSFFFKSSRRYKIKSSKNGRNSRKAFNVIVNYKECIGQRFKTNEGYVIEIIDYVERHHVLINFQSRPETQIWSAMQNISKGQIKNPYHRDVHNIGYYGEGRYTSRLNNIKTQQYIKWTSMFNRCYGKKYQEKEPSYIGCIVANEFHNFQNFAQRYDRKIYMSNHKLELDKDLLYEGNKIYSPSRCCFIPKEINNALKYKRNDKYYMDNIYQKYKKDLHYYLRLELYKLTNKEVSCDELS